MEDSSMSAYKEAKRLAKRLVVALYWEFCQDEDDFMESIAVAHFDGNTGDDVVVAMLDQEFQGTGKKAVRIQRTRIGKGRAHGRQIR